MKNFRLSSIAAAVGLVVAGAASAQAVNLDAPSPTTVKYAAELSPTSTNAITLRHGAAAVQQATVNTGATLAVNAVGYIRIDVGGATFAGTPGAAMLTVVANDGLAAANATIGVAQQSTNYAIFTVTPPAGGRLVQNGQVTIDTDEVGSVLGLGVTGKDGVTLRYRLYDNLGDASAQNANAIKDTGAKAYIAFVTSLSASATAGTATADVSAATGAYNRFTGTNSFAVGGQANAQASLGSYNFTYAAAGNENGVQFGTAALGSTSSIVVTATSGNFSFAANANGGFDTLSRVTFSNTADCVNTSATATALTSTTATFSNVPAAFFSGVQTLCVTARTGTPLVAIAAATYSLSSTLVPSSATVYGNIASPSSSTFGTIRQNGATINIPLVQTPAGFLIRLAVMNNGTGSRAYTVSTVAETGATATVSGALASGTFEPGKLTVIDLPGLLTVTGAPNSAQRSALRMIVNAPASEIKAVYQVTAPNGTSVSNQPLTVE
jgi:hypothetical protein